VRTDLAQRIANRDEDIGDAIRVAERAVACEPHFERREQSCLNPDKFRSWNGLTVAPPVGDPKKHALEQEFRKTGAVVEFLPGQRCDTVRGIDRQPIQFQELEGVSAQRRGPSP
jgi:hypothetical protein